jgi:2-oxoglutarate ferredoxin oxidoreductase subunit delta
MRWLEDGSLMRRSVSDSLLPSSGCPIRPNGEAGVRSTNREKTGGLVAVDRSLCKACGICTALCPREALQIDKEGYPVLCDPERCTSCRICELHCPDFAITMGLDGAATIIDEEVEG